MYIFCGLIFTSGTVWCASLCEGIVMNAFDIFRKTLVGQGLSSRLRAGMIGKGVSIPGPFGPKPLIYADYVALV